VQRRGEELAGEQRLAVGDTLLLQGRWDALDRHLTPDEVLVVDPPDLVRRAVPLGVGARRVLIVLAAMVVLLATGAVPPAVAGLLAAGALVVSGALPLDQAYRGVSWTTVILVGGMLPLSTAMISSGAAERLADQLVDVVGNAGPYALLTGLFVVTVVLGQLISNVATALVVIPVAITAAGEMGVSVRPALMAVTVSAAAALLTPVATPANLMIMEPGGYRFGDYWKLGLPVLALFGVVAILLVPVFWPL
jgi:di/tricarboxylate transporter